MKFSCRMIEGALIVALLLTMVSCRKRTENQTGGTDSTSAAMHQAPDASNRGMASATFGSVTVSINYGRPQLKGRDMLGQATDGMVWRMGMNEATEIKSDADLKFGETLIPKGSYSLWMKKVSADQWHLVFNKKTGIWGHDHPAADDFAEAPLTMTTNPQSVETFTIELTATNESTGAIKAMWGTALLSTEFMVSGGTAM